MNQEIETLHVDEPIRSNLPRIVMVGVMCAMLVSIGALNGGSSLTASVWDAFVTTIQNILGSTFILFLVMLALLVTVWQLAHGAGYRNLTVVLGILVVGLIGPSLGSQVATATGPGDISVLEQPAATLAR